MQTEHSRSNQHSDGEPRYPTYVDGSRSSCMVDLLDQYRGGMTVAAIAAELGVSERYVYLVQRSALRKLKAAAKRKGLAP